VLRAQFEPPFGDTDIFDSIVKLIKGGIQSGTNQARVIPYQHTGYISYGGWSDLWGLSVTAADIKAPGFGVALGVKAAPNPPSAQTILVDHVRMTVYYKAP